MALVLAGCSVLPPPVLPTIAPAAWQQPTGSAGAASPGMRSWWASLGDGTLDALVARATATSLTLEQARSRVRQARLLAGRDNTQYLPTLNGGLRPVQSVSATDAFFQASLDAVWELGLFGARASLDRSAQARIDSAEAGLHGAAVSLVGEVVRSYTDLRAAQQQQALWQRLVDIDTRLLALTEVRIRHQLAASGEREQARARLAHTQAQQAQPRQIALHAAQGLATLLGQTAPDAAWLQPAPQPVLGDFALAQLPVDLLRFRPEIRQAEADVFRASGELGSAQAELYPRVALGSSLVYSYNVTQNRPLSSDYIPVIGPLVDIPIFDWARRRAAAGARREALDAALLAYRQVVVEGVAETEMALATLDVQREREGRLQAAHHSLQQRQRDQATLVRLGLASTLEQLAAERAACEAALELATTRAARTLALVALYKALGGAPLVDAQALAAAGTAGAAR